MWDFPYLNARIRDFKAKGEVGGGGGLGGRLGIESKNGTRENEKIIGIAGWIEIWVGITGLWNPIGGSLVILISNIIRLVEHLLP